MALSVARYQHEAESCPAKDPEMGRLLLGHLSEENASPVCEYLPSQRVTVPRPLAAPAWCIRVGVASSARSMRAFSLHANSAVMGAGERLGRAVATAQLRRARLCWRNA